MNDNKDKPHPKLTDRAEEGIQSIGELWESLAKFAQRRVEDNEHYFGDYPLLVRCAQMPSLKSLVAAIEKFHGQYE